MLFVGGDGGGGGGDGGDKLCCCVRVYTLGVRVRVSPERRRCADGREVSTREPA